MNSAETRALIAALNAAHARGERAALATVVGVQGSAYRREGTRMLVLEDGAQVCMLSGGCLEAEVVAVALEVIASGQPSLTHYDLSEDATWGLGIGCGGSVTVWVERVEPSDTVTRAWLGALERGEVAALVWPLVREGQGRLCVGRDGVVIGHLTDPALHTFAVEAAHERLRDREPRAVTLPGPAGQPLFIDINPPVPELVLYGAGHDALPLAAQAQALGYRVQVIDPRPAYLTSGRFPGATLHLLAPQDLDQLPSGWLALPERAHLIVMNHHLERDRLCLAHALRSGAGYVGVLGPHSRAQRLLEGLEADGASPDPLALKRLRSPIGLRLGAESPEEVALSVLAELMAWRRGYSGGFLNGQTGRIHDADVHALSSALEVGATVPPPVP